MRIRIRMATPNGQSFNPGFLAPQCMQYGAVGDIFWPQSRHVVKPIIALGVRERIKYGYTDLERNSIRHRKSPQSETAGSKIGCDPRYVLSVWIGELVASRKAANLTQAQVAEKWGRQKSILGKVQTYERRIDLVEFIMLASIVGLDPIEVVVELKKLIDFDS